MLNAKPLGDTMTPDMAPRPFGKIIKTHRLRRGLTQAELAEESGISRFQTISEIERDRYVPNIPDAKKIASALGLSLADLILEWEGGPRRKRGDESRETTGGTGESAANGVTPSVTPGTNTAEVAYEPQGEVQAIVIRPPSLHHVALVSTLLSVIEDPDEAKAFIEPLLAAIHQFRASRRREPQTPSGL